MLVGRLLTNGAMNARAVIALSEDWTFKMNAQVGGKKCFCVLEVDSCALAVAVFQRDRNDASTCTAKSFNPTSTHHLLRGSVLFCELISGTQNHNIKYIRLQPVPSKGLARAVLEPFVSFACPLFVCKGSSQCPLYGRVLSHG
jgi:hypothetical protein